MFKVGSSINIQPLINADGSYKKYQPPVLETEAATDASGKRIQHKTTAASTAASTSAGAAALISESAQAGTTAGTTAANAAKEGVTEPTKASAEQ